MKFVIILFPLVVAAAYAMFESEAALVEAEAEPRASSLLHHRLPPLRREPPFTRQLVDNPVVYNYNLAHQVGHEFEVDAERSTPEVMTKRAGEELKINPIVYSTPYGPPARLPR